MNIKTKIARKALAWLVSIVMVVVAVGVNPSFSAFANEQQEIDFCVDKMKNIPTDDEFLNQMKKLPKEEELDQSRHEDIVHSDGSSEPVDLNEKEVYAEIKRTVEELTKDFETQESAEEMLNFTHNLLGEDSKEKVQTENSNGLPANMKKANAIYRWVAENIKYDNESYDAIRSSCGESVNTLAKWKPQDAYFVFAKKTGVCAGYARLLKLMMRMAEIPCMYVDSINGPTENYGHAFNAVYLEDQIEDRKGWTLLDSCWASPMGSDGDAEIKIHLSGEMHFSKEDIEDALAVENEYINELYNSFEVPENDLQNLNPEIIENLNKKVSDVLKTLNEKHTDSPHFETIEFFDPCDSLHFKYKTNLTMEQAKQAKDRLKELKENRAFEYLVNQLTGKTKIYCTYKIFNGTSGDMTIEDLKMKAGFVVDLKIRFEEINDNNEKIKNYCDELEKIYIDLLFPNLNKIGEKIEELNKDLNKKLEKLNEKYSDITTIKSIKLSIEKDDEGYCILGEFDTGLNQQDLKTRFEKNKDNIANKRNEGGFAVYFPAFYQTDQSFEEANRSIVVHEAHKISIFEDISDETIKINRICLPRRCHEGRANIEIIDPRDVSETVLTEEASISDSMIKFDGQEYNIRGLEINNICSCENLIIEGSRKARIIAVKNVLIKDNVTIETIASVENLTIEGDATIDISKVYDLKNIDTTKSKKYHAENGILYHTVDDKPGTKGEEIGEIFRPSLDLG